MLRGGLGYHTQTSPTCWDPYLSLPIPGRNRNTQLSLHQQLDRWYCHGHIHVKSRPRWPHASSPCHALPWIHVLAVQMVNAKPQLSTNTNWRSTVWLYKPGSVKIQTNVFWNWYFLIENHFLSIKCKEHSIDCTSALMFVLFILRLSRNAVEFQTVS